MGQLFAVLTAFIAVAVFKYLLTAQFGMSATTSAFDPAGSTPLGSLPAQVLLLQAVDVTDQLTWNTPSWSISAEFWTYILFALIVLLAQRYRTIVFAATAALGAATLVAFSQHGMDTTYDLGLPRCIFGFSVGYLVYWARPRIGTMPSAIAPLAEVLIVLAIVAFVAMTNRSPASYAAPFVFAIAVYVFGTESGPVSRLLQRPVFQNLGLWSYSIYMLHALIAFVIGLAVSELQKRLGVDLWQAVVEDGISKRVIVPTICSYSTPCTWPTPRRLLSFLLSVVASLSSRDGDTSKASRTAWRHSAPGWQVLLRSIRRFAKARKASRVWPPIAPARVRSHQQEFLVA